MPEATLGATALVAPQAPSKVYLRQIIVPKSDNTCDVEIRWTQNVSGNTYEIKGYYIEWALNDSEGSYNSAEIKKTWFYYTPTGLDRNSYTFSISNVERGKYLHLGLNAGYQDSSGRWYYTTTKMAEVVPRISPTPSLKITNITDTKDLTRLLNTSIDIGFTWKAQDSGFNETYPTPYTQIRCFNKDLNISYNSSSITLYSGDFYFAKKENGGDLSDLLVKSIYLYIYTGHEKFRYLIKFDDEESEYRDKNLSKESWVPWNPSGDPVINFYNYKDGNTYSNKTIQNSGNLFYIDKDLYIQANVTDGSLNLNGQIVYSNSNTDMDNTEEGHPFSGNGDSLVNGFCSHCNAVKYPYNTSMTATLQLPFKNGAFSSTPATTQYKTITKTIYFLKEPNFSLSFNSAAFKPYLSETRSLFTTIDLTGVALESASPISATLEYTTDNWVNTVSTTGKTLAFDSNNNRYETTIAFADLFEKQQNDPTKTNSVSATNTIAAKIRLKFEDSFGNIFSSKESNLTVDFSEHPKPNSLTITTSITDDDEYSYLYIQEGLNFSIGYTITGFPGLYFARVFRNESHITSQPLYQNNPVRAVLGQTGWMWELGTSESALSLGKITAISDNNQRKWQVIAFDSNRVDGKESNKVPVYVIKHIAPTITINSITATDKNNVVVNYTISDSFNNGNGTRSRYDALVWGSDGQASIYTFSQEPSTPIINPEFSISKSVVLTNSDTIPNWDTKNFKIRVQTVTSQQGTKQSDGETVSFNYEKTKTVESPEILVYNVVPTVSYRKNQIGINTSAPRNISILDVHPTSTNKLITLTGTGSSTTSSRIVINLEDMTIDIIEEPLTTL